MDIDNLRGIYIIGDLSLRRKAPRRERKKLLRNLEELLGAELKWSRKYKEWQFEGAMLASDVYELTIEQFVVSNADLLKHFCCQILYFSDFKEISFSKF